MKNIALLIVLLLLPFYSKSQGTLGFFLDDWQPKSIVSPAYTDTSEIIGRTPTIVTVDFDDTIAKVSNYVYGNNGNPYSGKMNTDAALLKYINDLNPHVIRWPGGNLSQEYFWDRSTRPSDIPSSVGFWGGKGSGQTNNDYYDLLNKTNSTGSICINFAYARYGTGPTPINTAAHYAAEWVRYDNGRSKFWELGNENFGSWEAGYRIDTALNKDDQPEIISGELYGNICRIFIDSMRTAAAETGADIKIGAVAMDQNVTYDPVQQHWNEQMMPILAGKADFIIVHSYYTPYNENSSVATILNSPSVTSDILNYINAGLTTAGYSAMPIALTEWNIFAIGSKQAVSFINGMQSALNIGELIKNKYGMAMKWNLANGYSNGDDHGMFASSNETDVPFRTPHPQFHYMYYFQKCFGDHMVNSTVTGNSDVVAYASAFSSGQAGIMLTNKSKYEQKVTLDLKNFETGQHLYKYTLTGGNDNGDFSRKVFINGQGPTTVAGGPANYASIKPRGLKTDDCVKLSLPPLSAIYAIIDPKDIPDIQWAKLINDTSIQVKLTSAVQVPDTVKGFSVLINNSGGDSITMVTREPGDSTILVLTIDDPLSNTDTVSLSYLNGNFSTYSGKPLLNIDMIEVENLLYGSSPKIIEAYTDTAGTTVFVRFNKKMAIIPEGSYSLKVSFLDKYEVNVNNPGFVDEDSLIYSFLSDEPLFYDYAITLSFADNVITSADGGILKPIDSLLVENYCPLKPADILNAYTSTSGDSIYITFDKVIKPVTGLINKFVVTLDGVSNSIKKVTFPASQPYQIVILVKNKISKNVVDIFLSYIGTTLMTYDDLIVGIFNEMKVENLSTYAYSSVNNYHTQTSSIYPNPAKNEITIQSEKPFDMIAIFSMDGRKVYERVLNNYMDNTSLSLSLSKGDYILKLGDDNYFESRILMVE